MVGRFHHPARTSVHTLNVTSQRMSRVQSGTPTLDGHTVRNENLGRAQRCSRQKRGNSWHQIETRAIRRVTTETTIAPSSDATPAMGKARHQQEISLLRLGSGNRSHVLAGDHNATARVRSNGHGLAAVGPVPRPHNSQAEAAVVARAAHGSWVTVACAWCHLGAWAKSARA